MIELRLEQGWIKMAFVCKRLRVFKNSNKVEWNAVELDLLAKEWV